MDILRSSSSICWFLLWMVISTVCSTPHSCPENPKPKICDYIVVGAGAAGATIASRLSEDPSVTVCLFEAGISDTSPEVAPIIETPGLYRSARSGPITYNHTSVPQKGLNGRTIRVGMGKTLGGSTSHNVMGFYRGFKADYDYWAANGADGWSYKDVLPFFLKMENNLVPELKDSPFHSTCGPFAVSQDQNIKTSAFFQLVTNAAKETGVPTTECNKPSPFGVCPAVRSIKNGVRVSTSTAYLRPVSGRRNLIILTEALVEKILISRYNKKAYGIRYSKGGRIFYVKARREVIVSGGSYGSVQLLQLSGVGPGPLLRKLQIKQIADLPVGYNLNDHLIFYVKLLINFPVSMPDELNNPDVLADYIFRRTGKYAAPTKSAISLFLDTNKATDWPEALIRLSENGLLPVGTDPRNSTAVVIYPLHPKSRGTVQIKNRNPSEAPVIDGRWLQVESDVKIVIDAVRELQRIVTVSPSMQAVKASIVPLRIPEACRNFKPDSTEHWECAIRGISVGASHPAGTCKMGSARDKNSVVDYKLRVYGIKGLRVADASIMPEVTSSSTMGPAIMIGEKAADIIKQDYNSNSKA